MTTISRPYGFRLTTIGEPLERWELPDREPEARQVVVEVAGCGVCHTDVSFAVDGVPTRHPLPLVLGHEISGRVVDAGIEASDWIGKPVIVPAVVPCGECEPCQAGRPTICKRQFMPGNHGHGGFATHVTVPSYGLCEIPEHLPPRITVPLLSVIADAVTTPLEAMSRAGLSADHLAVFIGVGGVGGFGVQLAAAREAAVVAIDVDPGRLELAAAHGADLVLNPAELDTRELKAAVREFARASGRRGIGTRIFETSGTAAGQQTAWSLLDPGAHLAVVGFTPQKLKLRLSNLMAFDATAQGNWGSAPERYPEALRLVLDGKVLLEPFVEMHSLDRAPEVLQAVADHQISGRAILLP